MEWRSRLWVQPDDPFAGAHFRVGCGNIAVCLGNFYQGLLGCDLLCGYNEALGTATITLPRLD